MYLLNFIKTSFINYL